MTWLVNRFDATQFLQPLGCGLPVGYKIDAYRFELADDL